MDDNVVGSRTVSTPSVSSDSGNGVQEGNHFVLADDGDMPLEIYERENRDDYVLKALNMEERMDLLPKAEQDNLKAITKYVRKRMDKEGYEPTTKAYRAMFTKITDELNIDKNVSRESLMDRITGYIESMELSREVNKKDEPKLIEKLRGAKSREEMIKIVMGVLEKII